MEYEQLSGVHKAAILMVALGVEAASEIFKSMPEAEMEEVAMNIGVGKWLRALHC